LLWLQELQVRLKNRRVGYVVVFQLVLRKVAEFLLGTLWIQIQTFAIERLESTKNGSFLFQLVFILLV